MVTLAVVIGLLVGSPVSARCEPVPPGFLGMTWFSATSAGQFAPTSISLAPGVCAQWARFTPTLQSDQDYTDDVDAGVALFIATHEAEHFRYADANEAPTECRALRDFGRALDIVAPLRSRFDLTARAVRQALRLGARLEDEALPPWYHGASC